MSGHGTQRTDLVDLARRSGKASDSRVRQLVAEARVLDRVQGQLVQRMTTGIRTGALPAPAGSLARLFAATTTERHLDIALDIAGPSMGAWLGEDGSGGGGASGILGAANWGDAYLIRQGGSLGGGSTEMQRNIISERVLGMPREYAGRPRPALRPGAAQLKPDQSSGRVADRSDDVDQERGGPGADAGPDLVPQGGSPRHTVDEDEHAATVSVGRFSK